MAPAGLLLLCLLLAALLAAPGCSSAGERPGGEDGYQVIMWVLGGVPEDEALYFRRLRELNVTAIHVGPGESPEAAERNGFGFYVENLHRIAFLHGARPIYEADWEGYTRTRDKKFLTRKPCLHDAGYLAEAKQDIQRKVGVYAGHRPLLYDMGDECSITSYASPMDYCFSEHTLAAFREWLRGQYGTLERLNEEWETEFAGWGDVVPMTTYEIKDRERRGSENYAPWADHRTFMDIAFAETLDEFRGWIHEVDPETPAGLEGTQMPAAFGGYDLWRLSQALDWVEPYDIGNAHAVWRSFLPAGTPMFATVFEHDPKQASRRLWHLLLNGDRGCIIWASSEWFDYGSPDLKPQPWVAGMAEVFAELRGPAARAIMGAKRDRAPIAIHYSQPSIQVGWMLDSREDGDSWPRRFSSYEGVHSRIARVRNGWCKVIEDLGLQCDFVSTQEVLDGRLAERGYRALVLPQSLAIGDEEAAKIREFAQAGGTVIADCLTGVFDEHGKRREVGVLDEFFDVSGHPRQAIRQPERSVTTGSDGVVRLVPAEEFLTAANTSAAPWLVHEAQGGRACYLNFSPIDYPRLRLQGEGGELRERIGSVLSKAGARPAVKVAAARGGPAVGCEVITYQREGRRYVAIMRNPEYSVGSLGEIGYTDNSRFERPVGLAVEFEAPVRVREVLSGRDLGEKERVEVTLDPWKPVVLEIR